MSLARTRTSPSKSRAVIGVNLNRTSPRSLAETVSLAALPRPASSLKLQRPLDPSHHGNASENRCAIQHEKFYCPGTQMFRLQTLVFKPCVREVGSQREFCRGFANWNEIIGKRADHSTFKRYIRLGTESADIAGVMALGGTQP
jgi:hypothetical protein